MMIMDALKMQSAALAFGFAATLMSQAVFASHTSEFYDMNSGAPFFAPFSPTTPNSALGVGYGLTGNYLGAFGDTSVTWQGLDNQSGLVSISFDLIVRGYWLPGDAFGVTFSSSDSVNSSPVDTLVAFTPFGAEPINTAPLPAGVSHLYAKVTDPFEMAYHITTTAHALGIDSFSSASTWTLTFSGAPSPTFSTPNNGTWGIDNLDIRWGASAVPEPDSVMLLVSALPLIAGAVYRRRRLALS